jgi:hypothetical protein
MPHKRLIEEDEQSCVKRQCTWTPIMLVEMEEEAFIFKVAEMLNQVGWLTMRLGKEHVLHDERVISRIAVIVGIDEKQRKKGAKILGSFTSFYKRRYCVAEEISEIKCRPGEYHVTFRGVRGEVFTPGHYLIYDIYDEENLGDIILSDSVIWNVKDLFKI